jgi:FtsP/CotA-like multicopper oxidase with cupredoxin domain
MGMGVIVEYAGQRGEPRWSKPQVANWVYTVFSNNARTSQPDHRFGLVFEKIPGGRGGINRWTINGKSFPDTDPLPVQAGRRYRLVLQNKSGDAHPIHLHRHTFEITKFKDASPTSAVSRSKINFRGSRARNQLSFCLQKREIAV